MKCRPGDRLTDAREIWFMGPSPGLDLFAGKAWEGKMDYAPMAGLGLVVPPDDFDPLESQRELQSIIFGKKMDEGKDVTDHSASAESVGELLHRIRFNHEAYCAEHQEMLEFLPWKEWKTYDLKMTDPVDVIDKDIRLELKFEAIDKLHFLINDFIALDMDWPEVMAIYATKQSENRARQERGY